MASNLLIYYFGDDEAYFKALQGEFRKHVRMPMEFKRFYQKEENKIQSLMLEMVRGRPACVFIDFSKQTQEFLHLARIISRSAVEHSLISVGLLDYLSPPEILTESIATGVQFSFIKSADIFDVIYSVMKKIAPAEIAEHGFATAALTEEVEASIPCKIGYVHNEGLHIETDFKLVKGSKITMNHFWLSKKLIPSRTFFVKEASSLDIFYHFKYNAEVEFLFVDEVVVTPERSAEELKQQRNEREDLVIHHRKQLKKWVQGNLSLSHEKRAKFLVIDREFLIYDNQPRTDKHNYTIRCLPFIENVRETLERFRPQVIAFAMEDDEEAKNTFTLLEKIVKVIKTKYCDDVPFIIVFNCAATSGHLQHELDYPSVITSGQMSGEVLHKIAALYEKKMQQQFSTPPKDRVFIRKTNIASICEIAIPIKIIKLSESDITFECAEELPVGCNLHIKSPVEMYLHVQPSKGQGKVTQYHGLIHSIGEDEKKELRRYVNSIFFREHDGKKQAELDAFNNLNNSKLQAKLDVIKREQEALLAEQEAKAAEAEAASKKAQADKLRGLEKPVEISPEEETN